MTLVIFFITTAQKNTQKFYYSLETIVIHSRFSSVCMHSLYVRYLCTLLDRTDWTERITTTFRYDTQLKAYESKLFGLHETDVKLIVHESLGSSLSIMFGVKY